MLIKIANRFVQYVDISDPALVSSISLVIYLCLVVVGRTRVKLCLQALRMEPQGSKQKNPLDHRGNRTRDIMCSRPMLKTTEL